jgi:hypothetical protein
MIKYFECKHCHIITNSMTNINALEKCGALYHEWIDFVYYPSNIDKKETKVIKFITEQENTEQLTFGMVKEHQFFIDEEGNLCQKLNSHSYFSISDVYQKPCCIFWDHKESSCPIKKILPHVTKIEF